METGRSGGFTWATWRPGGLTTSLWRLGDRAVWRLLSSSLETRRSALAACLLLSLVFLSSFLKGGVTNTMNVSSPLHPTTLHSPPSEEEMLQEEMLCDLHRRISLSGFKRRSPPRHIPALIISPPKNSRSCLSRSSSTRSDDNDYLEHHAHALPLQFLTRAHLLPRKFSPSQARGSLILSSQRFSMPRSRYRLCSFSDPVIVLRFPKHIPIFDFFAKPSGGSISIPSLNPESSPILFSETYLYI
ncbi:hypothetical protein KSP39_PZI018932 [Platanthera zijinensis]|uniref:Uncharacterized protein n=1 Tax=Platanthera zijinensis TaxID=2320716 RepID=A0AAP0B3L6_9ASPA